MMTDWLIYLSPIVVGFVAGLLYGMLFFAQQSAWLGGMSKTGRISQLLFFLMRIMILFYTARYLLRSELIPSILGAIVFIVVFWFLILSMKVFLHEWIKLFRG